MVKTKKEPKFRRGPYKIKKITKGKNIDTNNIDKIGYQEQLYASQEILKCVKENFIENFTKGIVRSMIIKGIQGIIDKLEKRKKNIMKYNISFNDNLDMLIDMKIMNAQTFIDISEFLDKY